MGFNKSHSVQFTVIISHRFKLLESEFPFILWRVYFPGELGNSDKLSHFIGESEMGIVLGPDVNESEKIFTLVFGGY